jgi:hypothetical protein
MTKPETRNPKEARIAEVGTFGLRASFWFLISDFWFPKGFGILVSDFVT